MLEIDDLHVSGGRVTCNGFCREVLQNLPMEFAIEARKLVGISLEGSVG
jgi:Fe-S cluster assembly scaffold protein SufB